MCILDYGLKGLLSERHKRLVGSLLEEFCATLRDELFHKAETEGNLNWLDPTVKLPNGYYLNLSQEK